MQAQQGRDLRPVLGPRRIVQVRVAARLQIAADEQVRVDGVEGGEAVFEFAAPLGGGVLVFRGHGLGGLLQPWLQSALDVLGQVQKRRLARAHKGAEARLVEFVQFQAVLFAHGGAMGAVVGGQGLEDVALLVGRDLSPLVHEGANGLLLQEGLEGFGVRVALGFPDDTYVFAAEAGDDLDADADVHVEDPGRFEEFARHLRVHVVVVDHGQEADALDPGVHDQVRRRLASLGVGVVDVVVEGQLVPLLGHFQEMVFLQLGPDHAGFARGGHAEVVGQAQLGLFVVPVADQLLHDLQQNAGGVFLQVEGVREQDFISQGAQGAEAFRGLAALQGPQEARDGVGHAQHSRRGHLLDAVGVHATVEKGPNAGAFG